MTKQYDHNRLVDMVKHAEEALSYCRGILITICALPVLFVTTCTVAMLIDDRGNCVSDGGCWDEVDGVCRIKEPNAQALCDRKK